MVETAKGYKMYHHGVPDVSMRTRKKTGGVVIAPYSSNMNDLDDITDESDVEIQVKSTDGNKIERRKILINQETDTQNPCNSGGMTERQRCRKLRDDIFSKRSGGRGYTKNTPNFRSGSPGAGMPRPWKRRTRQG
jgi:hypothetical protein